MSDLVVNMGEWQAAARKYVKTEDPGEDYTPREGQALRVRSFGIAPLRPEDPKAVTSGAQTRDFVKAAYHPVVRAALEFRLRSAFEAPFEWFDPNPEGLYLQYPTYKWLFGQLLHSVRQQVADYEEYGFQTFRDMLKGLLWNGMVQGFNTPEFVFSRQGLKWRVSEVAVQAPDLFEYYVNEVGQIEGFWYTATGDFFCGEEMGKFAFIPYPTIRNGNWYGNSLVQPVMCDVEFLVNAEESAIRTMRTLSVRPLLHKYKAGLAKRSVSAMHEALKQLESSSVLSVEMREKVDNQGGDGDMVADQEFEVLPDRASPEGIKMTGQLVEMYVRRINRVMGVPDDLGLTTTEGGSYAKAKTEDESVVRPATQQDRQYVANFVNTWFVPNALRYNWPFLPPGLKMPRIRNHQGDAENSL